MTERDHAPILVAEDNLTNQLALKALLNHFGQNADFVDNGQQCVESAQSAQYSLILMDLQMPILDGFEAAKLIRQQEYGTGQHTPIVAVTAMDPEPNKQKCIDAGMDDYIRKPIDHTALKEALDRWLPQTVAEIIQAAAKEFLDDGKLSSGDSLQRMQALYGTDHIAEILEAFLSVTDKLLESLQTAIETRDLSTAGIIAHEVKGSSLAVSAQEMVTLSIELELSIRAANWVEVIKNHSALATAFKRVTTSLKTPVGTILSAPPSE